MGGSASKTAKRQLQQDRFRNREFISEKNSQTPLKKQTLAAL